MNPLAPVLAQAVGLRARRLADRLESGVPAQDPAVVMAEQLRAVGAAVDVAPGERFRADLRTRLLAVAEVHSATAEPAPAPAAVSWRLSSRAGGALLAGLASVALLGGASVAGSQSLPGDAFYGVKRTQESLQLRLAGNDEARGLRHLAQATSRLGELRDLAGVPSAAGSTASGGGLAAGGVRSPDVAERVGDTLDDMDADTRRGQDLLIAAYNASGDQERLQLLSRWATGQSRGIEELVPSLPSSTRDRARESLSVVVAVRADAGRLLSTPDGCRPNCGPAASPGATPGSSGDPSRSGDPATSSAPGGPSPAPGDPAASPGPGAAVPGAPGAPGTPADPDAPAVPGVPGDPGVPGAPGGPVAPGAPDVPGVPREPVVPDGVVMPGGPAAPDVPVPPGRQEERERERLKELADAEKDKQRKAQERKVQERKAQERKRAVEERQKRQQDERDRLEALEKERLKAVKKAEQRKDEAQRDAEREREEREEAAREQREEAARRAASPLPLPVAPSVSPVPTSVLPVPAPGVGGFPP